MTKPSKSKSEKLSPERQLRKQLAAAQAAIKEHNSHWNDRTFGRDFRIDIHDTTALDAAIAEAVAEEMLHSIKSSERLQQQINDISAAFEKDRERLTRKSADEPSYEQVISAAQQSLVECLNWLRDELSKDEYFVEKIDIALTKAAKWNFERPERD